jgi:diguanylate cyclase (GGDEF)-like protein
VNVDALVGQTGQAVTDGARLSALFDLGLLDTEAEEEFDRYTRLASDLLGVPVSLVSLVTADRQFFKSQTGLPAGVTETPLSHSFCQHAVATQQPLIIDDAREHPLVKDNLAVRDLGAIAYAGMPLVLADGNAVGAFCAIDMQPRQWTGQDIRILKDLAAAVTAHLELRKALADQSLHDRLTGLPNRQRLCVKTDELLEAAHPAVVDSVAAICLGMDDFRLVNQAYGAATADQVLRQVGERLAGVVRGTDMLGRLRGDVFAVVGQDMGNEREALGFAERLRASVSAAEYDVDGVSIGMTATLGLATGSQGTEGADLLSRADHAMRNNKATGDVLMAMGGPEAAKQLRLRSAIGGALERNEISVVYQPLVDLADGTTVGFEALARWSSAELGPVPPADFIPVAERTGDIVKIGEWVLRTACAQAAEWRRDGADLSISVNLAPRQLELPNLMGIVEAALADHGVPPSALVLEITEGVLIGAGLIQTRNLQSLRELGVKISLDDFGTGYSALAYLKRFPLDQLKIDRSFMEGLEHVPRAAALVRAVLNIADALGLETVAEGIETRVQHEILTALGCRFGQGYLFARPLPASEIVLGPQLTARASGARRSPAPTPAP